MWYIILLSLLGLLFLFAEVLLLPGVSVGAVLALICYGSAVYLAFTELGSAAGFVVLVSILVVSLIVVVLSLRAKTWQRFSLNQKITSSSMPTPAEEIAIGAHGRSISRLAPMGKVEIAGRTYEAKSTDAYIDPKQEIEVVGFENFNVIVKQIQ